MPTSLPRLLSSFNQQLTLELQQLMQRFELPIDAIDWEVFSPNWSEDVYRQLRGECNQTINPTLSLYSELEHQHSHIRSQFPVQANLWQLLEDNLPASIADCFHYHDGYIIVNPILLANKRDYIRTYHADQIKAKGDALPPFIQSPVDILSLCLTEGLQAHQFNRVHFLDMVREILAIDDNAEIIIHDQHLNKKRLYDTLADLSRRWATEDEPDPVVRKQIMDYCALLLNHYQVNTGVNQRIFMDLFSEQLDELAIPEQGLPATAVIMHAQDKQMPALIERLYGLLPADEVQRLLALLSDYEHEKQEERRQKILETVDSILQIGLSSADIELILQETYTYFQFGDVDQLNKALEGVHRQIENAERQGLDVSALKQKQQQLFANQHAAKAIESISRSIGYGLFATSSALGLLSTLYTLSNKSLSRQEKAEVTISQAHVVASIPLKLASIFKPNIIDSAMPHICTSIIKVFAHEVKHQLRVSRLENELETKKDTLTEETDRLVAEFTRAKNQLLHMLKVGLAENHQQPLLCKKLVNQFREQLSKLADYYHDAMQQVSNATAKVAVKLQVTESTGRIKRLTNVVDSAFTLAGHFFPPAYLGLAMTGMFDIGMRLIGDDAIKSTAISNHGLEEKQCLIVSNITDLQQSLKQLQDIKEATLVMLPPTVKLDEIKNYHQAALRLPERLPELGPQATFNDIKKCYEKLQVNRQYLAKIIGSLTVGDGIPTHIINLGQLQASIRQSIHDLHKRIRNKRMRYHHRMETHREKDQELLHLIQNCQRQLNDAALTFTQNPVTLSDYTADQAQHYLKQKCDALIDQLNKYEIIISFMRPDKSITNLSLAEQEMRKHCDEFKAQCRQHFGSDAQVPVEFFEPLDQAFANYTTVYASYLEQRHHRRPIEFEDLNDFVHAQVHKVTEPLTLKRTTQEDEFRFVPNRNAFGLTKRRQQRRQVEVDIEHMFAEAARRGCNQQHKAKVYLRPYANESLSTVMNTRKLAGRLEGLKTEMQYLNLLLESIPADANITIAGLNQTIDRYTTLYERYRHANHLFQLDLTHFYSTATTRLGRWWAQFKHRLTNALFKRSAQQQCDKVASQLEQLRVHRSEPELADISDSTADVFTQLVQHDLSPIEVNRLRRQLEYEKPLPDSHPSPRPVLQPVHPSAIQALSEKLEDEDDESESEGIHP